MRINYIDYLEVDDGEIREAIKNDDPEEWFTKEDLKSWALANGFIVDEEY